MVVHANGTRVTIEIDPVAAALPLKRVINKVHGANRAEIAESLRLLGHDATDLKTKGDKPLLVRTTAELFALVRDDLRGLGHEQLYVASLSRYQSLLAKRLVYEGNVDSIQRLEVRDVFRDALITGADYIVLFHNHPTGYRYPSKLDKSTTKKMCKAGKLLGTEVLDHLICTDDDAFSMRRAKMLPKLERRI